MDRLRVFQIVVLIVAGAVAARLFYWQFIAKVEGVESQFLNEQVLPAERGEIYTADDFPAATNQEAFLIYGKPNEIKEKPEAIAKILAPYLITEKPPEHTESTDSFNVDWEKQKEEAVKAREEDLAKRLSNRSLFWVLLARKVPLEIKEKIESYKILGLGFEEDQKRFYPEASMAANLFGFVGSDKFGQDTGYFGLEGYFDRQLRGKPGRLGQETDPFGFPILVGKYRPIEPKKGASIYLTIDRTIQFMVEEKLRQAVEKYQAKEGTVVIQDPKTGNIIAMATSPTYNPAFWPQYEEKLYKNPVVADTYEPGSTFKLIAMAAALDLSLITPDAHCEVCTGPRKIGGFEISTWDKKYYPDSTMAEVLEHSDNIGMTYVADKLGVSKFYDYIKKFGFGKITGISLQEEAMGFVRGEEDWKPIDLATASFGQGLAVTPIQMVQAVSVIANSGKLIPPRVVAKIGDNDNIDEVEIEKEKQIISSKTATQLTEMMVGAVEKGEARAFVPKGYRIAGKTGTAQIPLAGHYDPNKTIASFVGFAPADDPKFVMLVRFGEPTSSPFGSETAAPTFFAIAKELFNYWGIAPKK